MSDEPERLASRRDDITHTLRMDTELDLEFTVFLAQTDLTISDAIRFLVSEGLRRTDELDPLVSLTVPPDGRNLRTLRMPRELDREMRVFMERAGLSVSDALRTLLGEGLRVRGIDLFSDKPATGKVA